MNELQFLINRIRNCTSCGLSSTRTNAVPGEGPIQPQLMLIGEGPGFHEDQQGRPFVGPSGKLLQELLSSINLLREEVYICNIMPTSKQQGPISFRN